ncbi:MAG: 50S ribosomal protein L25 [Candidatus Glassbacteria bacterium]
MKSFGLTVHVRDGVGKGVARKLRASGKVPAILYGHGMKSVPLEADEKTIWELIHSISTENTLIDLMVEGYRKKPLKALIREVQLHHYKPRILHVDFFQVSLKERIHVEIPVILQGNPDGVKNFGGVLEHHLRDIAISCLPGDIPEKIEIDVTGLGLSESVRVKDVELENVDILTDPEQPIATVLPPTVMKEVEVEEAVPEEEEEEPEVVGKAKKEEAEPGVEEAKGEPEKEQ